MKYCIFECGIKIVVVRSIRIENINMHVRILYIVLFLILGLIAMAQKQASTPQRTPEQEAAKHTEMLARILPNISEKQKQALYDIHLKYIRERQEQPGRTATVERIRRKYIDYQDVLTEAQYEILQRQCENSRSNCPSPHNSDAVSVPVYSTNY